MGSEQHKLVPAQMQGLYKDLKHDVLADNVEDAEELFVIAKDKLLDVNHWSRISTTIIPEFHLADQQGKPLERPAHGHDLVKEDDHGQMLIEEIAYDDYPDEDYETFAMRLRPITDPLAEENNATGTIVIERRGRHLTAHYYGRNENIARGTDAQWLSLITGLLQADIND